MGTSSSREYDEIQERQNPYSLTSRQIDSMNRHYQHGVRPDLGLLSPNMPRMRVDRPPAPKERSTVKYQNPASIQGKSVELSACEFDTHNYNASFKCDFTRRVNVQIHFCVEESVRGNHVTEKLESTIPRGSFKYVLEPGNYTFKQPENDCLNVTANLDKIIYTVGRSYYPMVIYCTLETPDPDPLTIVSSIFYFKFVKNPNQSYSAQLLKTKIAAVNVKLPGRVVTTWTTQEIYGQDENSEDDECIICFSEKRDILLFPCNHLSMCHNCYTRVCETQAETGPKCPVCRTLISRAITLGESNFEIPAVPLAPPIQDQYSYQNFD